jgi:hypothetical protein
VVAAKNNNQQLELPIPLRRHAVVCRGGQARPSRPRRAERASLTVAGPLRLRGVARDTVIRRLARTDPDQAVPDSRPAVRRPGRTWCLHFPDEVYTATGPECSPIPEFGLTPGTRRGRSSCSRLSRPLFALLIRRSRGDWKPPSVSACRPCAVPTRTRCTCTGCSDCRRCWRHPHDLCGDAGRSAARIACRPTLSSVLISSAGQLLPQDAEPCGRPGDEATPGKTNEQRMTAGRAPRPSTTVLVTPDATRPALQRASTTATVPIVPDN